MTQTPDPTWYDVLGVAPDATPGEIKAAWREATDKFEPGSGSGQFRMFNDAADVLLDPQRRAAYDQTLPGAASLSPTRGADPQTAPAPPPESGSEPESVPESVPESEPVPVEAGTDSTPRRARSSGPASRRAGLLTLVLAVLTVTAMVAAGYFGLKVRSAAQVADARTEAPAAAERAAKAMLSYDYQHLPADRARASAYLTDSFRTEYLKNFSLLEKQKDGTPGAAVQTKTVVTSSVLGSGVMDAEPDLVRVLVYVNQVSKKPDVDPQIFQNRVAMTMKKVGSRWLVDNLKSY